MEISSKMILPQGNPGFASLLGQLRGLIQESRQQLVRAVDVVQVRTCWEVGRHIVEFEQGGAARAEYGAGLLRRLAEELKTEFGKGFDASNLRYMRLFYQAFPICDALRLELSWTHYRLLLRVDNAEAREWYVNETAIQNWSTRALDQRWASSSALTRMRVWSVTQSCMEMSSFLPPNTVWCCPLKKSCVSSWNAKWRCWSARSG
jgi:hypothetical protein